MLWGMEMLVFGSIVGSAASAAASELGWTAPMIINKAADDRRSSSYPHTHTSIHRTRRTFQPMPAAAARGCGVG